MTRTVAVVPIRGSLGAKTRLASMFSDDERSRLVWHMLRRVIGAIDESNAIDHTLVVTYEPEAVARQVGEIPDCTILAQSPDLRGLNAALHLGRDWSVDCGYRRMIILSADLPTIDGSDVRLLASSPSPLVIAPDRHGTGTNALALDLGQDRSGAFAFQFGHGSRDLHVEEARQVGLDSSIRCRAGLQRDLDTPGDWLSLPDATRDELLSVAKQSVMTPNP